MRFVTPTEVTSAKLISSTRAENDYAAWSSGTTYALAARCISATTHRIYESVQAGNTNHDPTTDTGTWWLDVGPTNRWAMFDTGVGTATAQATPLTVVIDTGIIDSLVLLDIAGTSVAVSMTDGAGGATVYNASYDLPDNAILLSWSDYFFADIEPSTTLIVDDLPPYQSGRLTVSIAATTTAECGTLVIGRMVDIGQTLAKPTISIADYSRKETDDFGVTDIVERAYAKKIEARFMLPTNRVDYAAKKLAAVRATPVVWLADDSSVYDSLVAYGFYRDWGIDISYPTFAEASITIEGLT